MFSRRALGWSVVLLAIANAFATAAYYDQRALTDTLRAEERLLERRLSELDARRQRSSPSFCVRRVEEDWL